MIRVGQERVGAWIRESVRCPVGLRPRSQEGAGATATPLGRDGERCLQLDERAHITFAGLVRLGRHVLDSFIDRQPVLEREEYHWRGELPGQMQVVLAPEYWAGRTDGFQPSLARQRFSGFVEHLVMNFSKPQPPLLDLRPLMERIEALAPSAKAVDRPPMLALYWMFNGMILSNTADPVGMRS